MAKEGNLEDKVADAVQGVFVALARALALLQMKMFDR